MLKIGVVIVPRIRILDASTEEYQEEEEEVYFQGEEDHFDQYTNQGKLIFLQSAKLYPGKAHSPITLCSWSHPKFYSCKVFTLFIKAYFYS